MSSEPASDAFIVVVMVTTAGLSALTIGAKEPCGATTPATASDAAEAWAEDVSRANGSDAAPIIKAAPTSAAVRCFWRMDDMAMVLARSEASIKRPSVSPAMVRIVSFDFAAVP